MVAEDSLVGSLGVTADDENHLEMERMPMGYGCPGITPALHGIYMPKRSHDVQARVA